MVKYTDIASSSDELSTKEKLILEAIRLFSKNGFEGTTTRMLADAIKANNSVVFSYFKSKEHLYSEVLNTVAAYVKEYYSPLEDETNCARNNPAYSPDDAWEYIKKYIELYITLLQDPINKDALYLLLHEEITPANTHRPITRVVCESAENIFKQLLLDYWQSDNIQAASIASRLTLSSLISLGEHPTFIRYSLNLEGDAKISVSAWNDIRNFTLNSLRSYRPE